MKCKRPVCLFLACLLVAAMLTGCSNTSIYYLYYDLSQKVTSLDPQFVDTTQAYTVLYNLFDGLLVELPDGQLVCDAAVGYEISDDRCRYTFTLRDDLYWSDGSEVTAYDYQFAFERIFNLQSPSPHAETFSDLVNATARLSGADLPLGVSAPDAHTLIFSLQQPNQFFLELLTLPAAFPCNEQFFEQTKGRYGLSSDFLLTNGAMTLRSWDSDTGTISLQPNTHHPQYELLPIKRLTFYYNREETLERFSDGRTDAVAIDYSQLEMIEQAGGSIQSFEDTTWVLVINCADEVYGNQKIREALLQTINRSALTDYLTENYTLTEGLIPHAATVSGLNYREQVGMPDLGGYQPQNAKALLEEGLAELQLDRLPKTTLLVPDTGDHAFYMGFLQQAWQRDLSTFINTQPQELQTTLQQVASGDFTLALIPVQLSSANPYSLLSQFAGSDGADQLLGWQNTGYAQLLQQAMAASSPEQAASLLFSAEQALLASAAVIPLYGQTSYYAVAKGAEMISLSAFDGKIFFYPPVAAADVDS